ncbi:argininosuccinate lyase [Portibacter lacus]|uniref:Argininosuccinate lyase n=1 Tax=Portibacter lacus TaxID=1099794 RepID=A0AA37ST48_9BACT|nr:argininosuccinate lyase [Portibacter lacus]GLR17540.1 argininosuccinate lyase [Portibacter lacus]
MSKAKLWSKGMAIDEKIEQFTIGKDRELDVELAKVDVLGSLAHVQMLNEEGIISDEEFPAIKKGLLAILDAVNAGDFTINEGVEDVHSQVELLLGKEGGRIHTGRSRNDQVLVDLKLFYRVKLDELIKKLISLSGLFLEIADKNKDTLMPGYTHTQVAMTSSFGMWFTAFAEAFKEDAEYLMAIFPIINKNPLGSAAGYGSSFPLNRTRTTELLGFESMHVNPINAQYGRGKSELIMSQALANISLNINKLATDMILYSNENYRFLSLPSALTTGSSIMPHKKNPDVFELIRAYSNSLMNLPSQITMIVSNLTTGYHRDFQLLKEYLFPAFNKVSELLDLIEYTLPRLKITEHIVEDEKYAYLLTVDAVNELVKKGIPFRDAYLQVGKSIEKGQFQKPSKLEHTHEGSLGNLGISAIKDDLEKLTKNNPYRKIEDILSKLISD